MNDREKALLAVLEYHGYRNIRYVNKQFCGIMRQIYTVGVFYGMTENRIAGRFCFDTEQNAELFLEEWDGETPPVVGVDGCQVVK